MSVEVVPQRPEAVEFFEQFIDDRFQIIEDLLPISRQVFEGRGYNGQLYNAPPELTFAGVRTGEAEIGLSYMQEWGGLFTPLWIRIQPQDGPPALLYHKDYTSETVLDDTYGFTARVSERLLSETMQGLAPNSGRVPNTRSIVEAIHMLCPESKQLIEVDCGDNVLTFTEMETGDDTAHEMSLRTRWKHASGKTIELAADVSESLGRATTGIDSAYDVDLKAGRPHALFSGIIDGQSFELPQPKRQHVQAFQNAVEYMLEMAMTPTDE